MTSFDSLPTELVAIVTALVAPEDVLALSRVNSLCRALVIKRWSELRARFSKVDLDENFCEVFAEVGTAGIVQELKIHHHRFSSPVQV